MNKKLKATMFVAALALAGGGTWKAYDYSESHKQSLMTGNINALSDDGNSYEELAFNPAVAAAVLKYGRIVLDLLALGMTLAEIIEYLNPPTHMSWVPTGPTREWPVVLPNGDTSYVTQYLHSCQEVKGNGDDACSATDSPKWI